ncbi:3-hydroxyacyl-CoA dehydrogenase NAD-binding domain-containing protein [Cellulomonas hominis]
MTDPSAGTHPSGPEQGGPPSPRPEHVAHTHVRDVVLPDGAGVIALVTIAGDLEGGRPTTLGPVGLAGLVETLVDLRDRAAEGEIVAVAVTGKPGCFAAGADLTGIAAIRTAQDARAIAEAGHHALGLLGELGVPSFAYVNGTALGGGLELALHCTYRTVAAGVNDLGLPESRLGLVPGWGGCYLLPRLVGAAGALDVILTRALAGRHLDAAEARTRGVVDAVLDAHDFLRASLRWTADVLLGRVVVERPAPPTPAELIAAAHDARERLDARLHGATAAPYRALELVAASGSRDRAAAFAAEDDALTDLLMSDALRAGLYAFDLSTRRARHPLGAPDPDLARRLHRVGVVGAGLMAAQLAVLLARRLHVPVTMREVDEERAELGRRAVRAQVDALVEAGRLGASDAEHLLAGITVTTDLTALAGSDLVIEAVTEVLDVKRQVFAALEDVVGPETVLATNTSALSVTAMAAGLRHPERVVGIHFFNPVARMPLVEVVRTAASGPEAVATAFALVERVGKVAVGVGDRPGFVVNRLLLRMLAEVADAVESGTPVGTADVALRPLGLPMGPFALLQLVGLPVGLHVLRTLHTTLGPRYPLSPGLERLAAAGRHLVRPDGTGEVDPHIQDAFEPPPGPDRALDGPGVLDAVLAGLAEEVGLMLAEGVVPSADQIDLCMILGAGWPLHLGGICPYLDRSGYAEKVLGHRLLPVGVASVPA